MDEFGVVDGIEAYAAAFTGGSILGAGLVSLQDSFGRIPVVRIGAFFATVISFLIAGMPSFAPILVLRVLLGVGVLRGDHLVAHCALHNFLLAVQAVELDPPVEWADRVGERPPERRLVLGGVGRVGCGASGSASPC